MAQHAAGWIGAVLGLIVAGCATVQPECPPGTQATGGELCLLSRVRVGFNPTAVAVTPDNAYVYVANTGGQSVSKIDVSSRRVVSTIELGISPIWLTLAPTRGWVCVVAAGGGDQVLFLLDIQGNYQLAKINLPYAPEQIIVDAAERYAYVTTGGASVVMVVGLEERRVVQNIAVNGETVGLALTPDGSQVYLSTRTDRFNISVLSTADRSVAARTQAGAAPGSIVMDPRGLYAYVVNTGSDDITVVHLPTQHNSLNLAVGPKPVAAAMSPNGKYLYVTCQQNRTLAVVDTQTPAVVATLDLGVVPWGVAVAPDGASLYVANYEAGGSGGGGDAQGAWPDATLGTRADSRVNNNVLLVVDPGPYR